MKTRAAEPHARIPSFAGHVPSSVERLARCRQCDGELPATGARRTFCSGRCVSTWKIRTQPGYARSRVKDRDRGVCCACGLDTVAARAMAIRVRQRLIAMRVGRYDPTLHPDTLACWPDAQIPGLPDRLSLSWWAADHITPVVEGGAEGGLDNLRTLCRWCHGDETRALARRRAGYRDPRARFNLLPIGLQAT